MCLSFGVGRCLPPIALKRWTPPCARQQLTGCNFGVRSPRRSAGGRALRDLQEDMQHAARRARRAVAGGAREHTEQAAGAQRLLDWRQPRHPDAPKTWRARLDRRNQGSKLHVLVVYYLSVLSRGFV